MRSSSTDWGGASVVARVGAGRNAGCPVGVTRGGNVAGGGAVVAGAEGRVIAGGGGGAFVTLSSPQDGVADLTGRGAEGMEGGGGGLRMFASSSRAGVYAVPYCSLGKPVFQTDSVHSQLSL
jgi:hypothetical protein